MDDGVETPAGAAPGALFGVRQPTRRIWPTLARLASALMALPDLVAGTLPSSLYRLEHAGDCGLLEVEPGDLGQTGPPGSAHFRAPYAVIRARHFAPGPTGRVFQGRCLQVARNAVIHGPPRGDYRAFESAVRAV
ncbi:hypothetical protein GCM10020254_82240 [Streptomyces goshikiensis]